MSAFRICRRKFLAGLACCGVLPPSARAQTVDLKSAARSRGLFWGAAVQRAQIERDADFAKLLIQQCSVIVPEWEMKWAAIESHHGRPSFAAADAIVAFAKRNKLKVRGHALLWHRSIPDWVKARLKEPPDWNIVASHISRMLQRYGADPVIHWDVLNEVIEPKDGRPDGLRASPFLAAFGSDYIQRALEAARVSAPAMRLYVNEYGVDYDGPVERNRRTAMLRLVEALKKAGVPLDGVGIQAHLRLDGSPFSAAALRRFLSDLASLGVKITISELDVRERNLTLPIAMRDKMVADEVSRYLDVILDEQAIGGIVTWGLSDRYSWLTPARLAAAGLRNRGLPYDDRLAAKPVSEAIVAALAKYRAR